MVENRIGETSVARNGQKMTIIAYRKYKDIDVQFEDGTIRSNINYNNFKLGRVENPNKLYKKPITTNRLNETTTAKNGIKMTIIAYRSSSDIDIQFEDGTIIKHKQYCMFKVGNIANPNIKTKDKLPHIWHIGEKNISKSGRSMTIVDWHNKKDIDIQFDDGIIVKHKFYVNFKRGSIAHPDDGKFGENWKYKNRLGETFTKSNGESMTITSYNNAHDFEVTFSDGTTVHCIRYKDFQNGYVHNPNSYKNKHIGEEIIAKNGLHAKIIDCENSQSIKVQFEDGTEVITNYRAFKDRNIKHPNISVATQKSKDKYIGKSFIAKNGMSYKVIDYKKADNILVEFEDGTQVNTTVSGICSGSILNPNYTIKNKRIGETNISSIGLNMSICDYISAKNIDIIFEDGYIAKNKSYKDFKNSMVDHKWPYQMNNILIEKPAYLNSDKTGNFYCTCTKCMHKDIWTIEEAKNHICEEFK